MTPADVMKELNDHVGATCGISAKQLAMKVTESTQEDSHQERQLRLIIADLRLSGIAICGHPGTGYYLPQNAEDINKTCAFLRSRALSSLLQESRLKKIALPELLGQMQMEMENAA